ncbi:acetyl-CoA acetyltransferase [Marmoricola endophyticus]|uniref:Probable acetyl-CoA acetyltransferase n=1 Tax=Marmoricola endophyticus TaxID=2040280 RepID=A0A917BB47_9ACTN|nr:thiolase family protein [Marmoricola endophyticus]GGF33773.1 acetyl-CoA acetyltransferase [Marmoricola endophyticus]
MTGVRIVAALRTPIGTAGHGLADVDAAALAAPVLARLADVTGPPGEVVLGNCTGPGGDVARVASLAAGLGVGTPALTVDRQCGSGLAAIDVGCALVARSGRPVLAGGVESASTAPTRTGADGRAYDRAPFAPAPYDDPDMGLAADLLAEEQRIDRQAQDEYAARSHARAVEAWANGAFDDEVVPIGGLVRDERPRGGMTADRLARLRPAFRTGGTVTAGSSCGINDGAAAVALVPDAGAGPGLRVLATATSGVDPARPGIGLVPAVQEALSLAGLTLDDIDVVELNEAFAGQVLACCSVLGLDPVRVCPEGGALALGHPWGASGAVLVVRLWHQLLRGPGRYGLAGIAVGGGQGVAMVVEALP